MPEIPPPRFAVSDGLRIAYTDTGHGPPIVFLHGIGSTRRTWDEQVRALSQRFRCIAYDYRGYGESERPPAKSLRASAADAKSISRAAYARDLFAVMDAAGIDSAHLCGLSLGGVVALEAYAQGPDRVRSLILADAFARYPRAADSVRQRVNMLLGMGMERFAAKRSPLALSPAAKPSLIQKVRDTMASIPLNVYIASTRTTWTGDYRALLPKITVPTLVLWGEYDTGVTPRKLSEEIAHAVPTCDGVVVVPRAGHVCNLDNLAFFNTTVAEFISRADKM